MIGRARAYFALMATTAGTGAVARLLLLQLVVALMEATGLALLVPILQSLDGRDHLSLPGLDLRLSVGQAFALVIAVVLVRALGQWRVAVRSVDIRLATIDTLRLGLVDDLYAAEWTYLAAQRRSHVIQRLTTEVERAHAALIMLIRVTVGVLVLIATTAVAVLLSPVIGGMAALGLLLVVLAGRRSLRSAVSLGKEMTDRMDDLGAALTDSLSSARLMRAHDASAAWSDLVAAEAGRVRTVRRSFVRRSAGMNAILGVVSVVAVLVLILVGRAAGMSMAELAALAVVSTRLLTSAQSVIGSAQVFANEASALDRLTEFGAEVREHQQPPLPPAPAPQARSTSALVSLRGVTVRYAADLEPVLHAVDLDIPHRGLVTLQGESGSGKSTLVDVVLGLLRAESGEVLVDGEPRRDLAAWRRRIGYVPQQTVLVPGTVWQNLTWSLPPGRTVTEQEVWDALGASQIADEIAALPGGLSAPLHEMTALSGGEQQRLSIARAIVRDPELLVLDEATSALDPATEDRVLDGILDGSRAVLMVTHRLSARVRADVAARLDDGRLTIGDHGTAAAPTSLT
jgi:ATP-binding cassette subfamily C protein